MNEMGHQFGVLAMGKTMMVWQTRWKIEVVQVFFWLTEAEATNAVQNQVMQWFFE